jgi:hypothetical protein
MRTETEINQALETINSQFQLAEKIYDVYEGRGWAGRKQLAGECLALIKMHGILRWALGEEYDYAKSDLTEEYLSKTLEREALEDAAYAALEQAECPA